MIRESDIMHENGDFWVLRSRGGKQPNYAVMKNVGTRSVADSAYELSADGLSIAIARCDWLARSAAARANRLGVPKLRGTC